eukprot:11160527-Lingulodinium_polyedra.AAC.1
MAKTPPTHAGTPLAAFRNDNGGAQRAPREGYRGHPEVALNARPGYDHARVVDEHAERQLLGNGHLL